MNLHGPNPHTLERRMRQGWPYFNALGNWYVCFGRMKPLLWCCLQSHDPTAALAQKETVDALPESELS